MAANASFPPLDPIREAGARTDDAGLTPARASPPSVARPADRSSSRRSIRFDEARARTDEEHFAPACSSPPTVALRPRGAARSPMSGASLRAAKACAWLCETLIQPPDSQFGRCRAHVPPLGVPLLCRPPTAHTSLVASFAAGYSGVARWASGCDSSSRRDRHGRPGHLLGIEFLGSQAAASQI
jgi:hypothetical protein